MIKYKHTRTNIVVDNGDMRRVKAYKLSEDEEGYLVVNKKLSVSTDASGMRIEETGGPFWEITHRASGRRVNSDVVKRYFYKTCQEALKRIKRLYQLDVDWSRSGDEVVKEILDKDLLDEVKEILKAR